MNKIIFAAVVGLVGASAQAALYDLTSDWSNAANPNGPWAYREGTNALPAVASWQAVTGGWATAQPGWSESEDGNNRLPFWFQSNGTETFAHDFLAGDVVVHTLDSVNGVGNSDANVLWTSPDAGSATITGAVWMGRDIGRSTYFQLYVDGLQVAGGALSSGDVYDRDNPLSFSYAIPSLSVGDTVELRLLTTSFSGDFVGTQLAISTTAAVPEPAYAGLFALAGAGLLRRRS